MAGNTRKLHYKHIKDTAAEHVGHKGDIWYDPNTTTLRFYNGTAGGEALSSGLNASNFIDYGSDYSGAPVVPIDLTKKYHWLIDLTGGGFYTLADGVQGQEITFFPSSGLMTGGATNSDIYVTNVKYWYDNGPSSAWTSGGRIIRCFSHDVVPNAQGAVTATFVNGCWHFSGTVEDQGGLP